MSIRINKGDQETLDTPYGYIEYHEIWSDGRHLGWATAGFIETVVEAFELLERIDIDRLHKLKLKHQEDLASLTTKEDDS